MKIFKVFRFVLVLTISCVILTVYSCGQSQQAKPAEEQTINKDDVKESVSEIIQHIPSPFELAQKLDDIGAGYMPTALNDVEKIDKYFTEKNKALNLGVYGADLAYVTTYDKKQDVNVYAAAVKTLIDELNIAINFTEIVSEDTKEKMENKDTIVKVVTNTFYEVYDFLNENSDPSLAALVATGIWVESLYLAMQISEETFNNNDFVQIIYNQQTSLGKLIELLDNFKDDELIQQQKTALTKLKQQFESTDGSLTLAQLKSIGQTISTIRSSIVE